MAGPKYAAFGPVYLGDDLMSRQPICEAVQKVGGNFIFAAKPTSHQPLYEWIDGVELSVHEERVKKGRRFVTRRYRWIENLPPENDKDALDVNWHEIVNKAGKVTYRNSFVTDLAVTEKTVALLAACG